MQAERTAIGVLTVALLLVLILGFGDLVLARISNPTSGEALTGTIGVANGGTGSTTLAGIIVGNGTSAVNTLAIPSFLSLSGSTLSLGTLGIANGGTATTTQVTNGVNYFDGTRITSGTALAFDGTKLGIGTPSPEKALHIRLTSAGEQGVRLIQANGGVGDNVAIEMQAAGITTGAKIVSIAPGGTDNDLAFYTTDGGIQAELMRLSGNRLVGIGTSTPAFLLDVFSTGTTTVRADSNSATQGACEIKKDLDGSGYTYVTYNNGAQIVSTTPCN